MGLRINKNSVTSAKLILAKAGSGIQNKLDSRFRGNDRGFKADFWRNPLK